MKKLLNVFILRREERWPALVVMLLSVTLNVLFVLRLNPLFRQPGMGPYKAILEHEFHLSGYDPYTYWCVSDWDYYYNAVRHPLLAWLVWPVAQLNTLLGNLLGVNCAQFLMAAILTCCTVYSFVFLFRILREVIGLGLGDSLLLAAYFFSMAYIMLSPIVPDHFTPSMMLLLLTLYVSGHAMSGRHRPAAWQWGVLFLTTAGVTLTNGVKVLLAQLFVGNHAKRRHYMVSFVLPAMLVGCAALWQQQTIAIPRQQSHEALQKHKAEQEEQRIAALPAEQQKKEQARQARRQRVLRLQAEKTGKPVTDKGLLRWTDITTSRWQSLYENMLGESILFHQKHFLEDTLVHRPVFVSYSHPWAYGLEAVVAGLFLLGIWMGRRYRFLWLCLSMFGFDVFVHLLLGFGLNEVHIMAPHWAFVLPIATGYGLRHEQPSFRWTLRSIVGILTLVLFCCNSYQLVSFLLKPIHVIL